MEINKNTSIIFKGIAIIAVVAGHLGLILRGGAIGVSIFLALSGYGITRSWKNYEYRKYWKKRIIAVWLPYFIWTLILLIICLMFHYYRLRKMKGYDFILTLLGLHPTPILDPTMWYIPYIFLCYLILFITYTIFSDSKKKCFGIMLFCIAGGGMTVILGMHHATYYTFCFPIGCLVAIAPLNIKILSNKIGKYILCMCSLVSCLVFYIIADKHPIYNAVFVTLVSVAVLIWSYNVDLHISFLHVIGEASYAIYLCEGMFIYMWQDYYYFSNYLLKFFYCIFIIFFGTAIHYLYKKLWSKVINGGQTKNSNLDN